jgi:hypothetical protein
MPIIVRTDGRPARRLDAGDLPDEQFLQKYVVECPEVLPLDELSEDLRLVVLAKEVSTGSGSIDAVAIDQSGDLYLIETKLFRNTDKRRVVAQVLDYAAAIWSSQGSERSFRRELERAAAKTFGVQRIELALGLSSIEEAENLLRLADEAIQNGRFHLVVLMDQLDDRLKDLISFINENSNFDVLGVEMEFYRFDVHDVIIPRLHGAVARKIVPSPPPVWDAERFFREARRRLDEPHATALRHLFAFFCEHADEVRFGKGASTGSFLPTYRAASNKSVLTASTSGRIEVNFGWCRGEDGRPALSMVRLAEELRRAGLVLSEESLDRFPAFRADEWVPRVSQIEQAFRTAFPKSSEPPHDDAPSV